MPETHKLIPGDLIRINEITSEGRSFNSDKEAAKEEFRTLRDEIIELQRRLYAEDKHKLLIVFQAMDAGGTLAWTQ